MVREMRKRGLTLAEIALECDKSISWVYSRLDGKYSPGQKSEEKVEGRKKGIDEFEELRKELEEVEEELKEIEKRQSEIAEGLGHSPFRTDEELVEYRKKKDAVVGNPD